MPLRPSSSWSGSYIWVGGWFFRLLYGERIREGPSGGADEPAAQTCGRDANLKKAIRRVDVAAHPTGEVRRLRIPRIHAVDRLAAGTQDRKSTRLNSSHGST